MSPRGGGRGGGGGSYSSSSSSSSGSSSSGKSSTPKSVDLARMWGHPSRPLFLQTFLYGLLTVAAIFTLASLTLFILSLRTSRKAIRKAWLRLLSFTLLLLFIAQALFTARWALLIFPLDVPLSFRLEPAISRFFLRLAGVGIWALVMWSFLPSPKAVEKGGKRILAYGNRFLFIGIFPVTIVVLLALYFRWDLTLALSSSKLQNGLLPTFPLSDRDFALTMTRSMGRRLVTFGEGVLKGETLRLASSVASVMRGPAIKGVVLSGNSVYDAVLREERVGRWQGRRSEMVRLQMGEEGVWVGGLVGGAGMVVARLLMGREERKMDYKKGKKSWKNSPLQLTLFILISLLLTAFSRLIITLLYVRPNWSLIINHTLMTRFISVGLKTNDDFLPGWKWTLAGFPIIHGILDSLGVILAGIGLIVIGKRRVREEKEESDTDPYVESAAGDQEERQFMVGKMEHEVKQPPPGYGNVGGYYQVPMQPQVDTGYYGAHHGGRA